MSLAHKLQRIPGRIITIKRLLPKTPPRRGRPLARTPHIILPILRPRMPVPEKLRRQLRHSIAPVRRPEKHPRRRLRRAGQRINVAREQRVPGTRLPERVHRRNVVAKVPERGVRQRGDGAAETVPRDGQAVVRALCAQRVQRLSQRREDAQPGEQDAEVHRAAAALVDDQGGEDEVGREEEGQDVG